MSTKENFIRCGRDNCQVCGKKGKACMYSSDGITAVCTQGEYGEMSGTVAYLTKEWPNIGAVWYHKVSGDVEYYDIIKPEAPKRVEVPLAPIEQINKFYQLYKSKFPLTKEQTHELIAAGIFNKNRFSGSPPSTPGGKYIMPGKWPDGIPGAFKDKDGNTCVNTYDSGIVSYNYDSEERITSAEIKLDYASKERRWKSEIKSLKQDIEKAKDKPERQAKLVAQLEQLEANGVSERSMYRPLTSTQPWMVGGAKLNDPTSTWVNNLSDEIWITEGKKKGQVLADQNGVNVITLQGVANYSSALPAVENLLKKNKKIRKVIVAVDMDKMTNERVNFSNKRLIDLLIEMKTLEVKEAFWDQQYKGIDDAINNGAEINLVSLQNETYVGMEQARNQMIDQIYQSLTKEAPSFDVYKVSAGLGKTYATIQAINRLNAEGWPMVTDGNGKYREKKIAMCFDNNSLVQEMLPLFNFKVNPLEGRNPDEMSAFNCLNYEKVQLVAAAGQNTQKYVCAGCPYRESCKAEGYLGMVEKVLGERFILTNKSAILNRSDRAKGIDTIILDEGIRQHVQDEIIASPQDLLLYRMALDYAESEYKNNIIGLEGFDLQTPKRLESIKQHKEALSAISEQKDFVDQMIEDLQADEQPERHKRVFPKFGKFEVPAYIEMPIAGCQFPGTDTGFGTRKCWVKPLFTGQSKCVWHMPDGTILIRSINEHVVEHLIDSSVINLDATPIPAYLGLFNNVNIVDVNVQEHITVHSILDKKFAKTQLLKNEGYSELLAETCQALFMKHDGNIGFLTSKMFADVLFDAGIPEENVGWYGKDTRGSNRMQNVDAIVLAGPYIENMDSVTRDIEVLSKAGVEITVEDLQKQITSSETIQAIARGRGVSRSEENPLIVYKLTNMKIDGVRENFTYASCQDLLDGITGSQRSTEASQNSRQAKKAALEMVTMKVETVGQFRAKQEQEKVASNQDIASYDTGYASLYNKYKSQGLGGIIKDQFKTLIDLLSKNWATAKGVSLPTVTKLLEVMRDGYLSITDLMRISGLSRMTVIRAKRAVDFILRSLTGNHSAEHENDPSEALTEHVIENHFEEVLEIVRDRIPDHKIFSHAKKFNVDQYPELKQAIELLEKFPEPAQFDDGVALYWMNCFKRFSKKFSSFISRQRPDIVLSYFLCRTEMNEEIENAREEVFS